MTDPYDGLWESNNGTNAWVDRVDAEQLEWLSNLADLIVTRGSEPTWAKVGRSFRDAFSSGDLPVDSTISATVRRMVEQRQP